MKKSAIIAALVVLGGLDAWWLWHHTSLLDFLKPTHYPTPTREVRATGLWIDGFKSAVDKYYQAKHQWPATGQELDTSNVKFLPPSIADVKIAQGTITVTFSKKVREGLVDHKLSFRPMVLTSGVVKWICGHAAPKEPSAELKSPGPDLTDVELQYLPEECR
jgi:hypothetical protein